MNSFALFACALFVTAPLAGCTGSGTEIEDIATTGRPELQVGKGAIAGLLIDDVYRPIAGALVLLQELGLTATTSVDGEFTFVDLAPGSYLVRVEAPAHESAPTRVDVVAGQYAELELSARRIFSSDGYVITTEYSIFTACATSVVLVSTVYSCLADSDSYRPGLRFNNFTESNITYLVAEVKINQPDDYAWVLRCDDGSSFGCGEYAYVNVTTNDPESKGIYGRIVLKLGENYMNTWQSHTWNNTNNVAALLFYMGQGGKTITETAMPVGCLLPPVTNPLNGKPLLCRVYYGAGHRFAVQGRIIMSLFLGEPREDIASYGVLRP